MNPRWCVSTLVCGACLLLGAALAQSPPEIRIEPIALGGRPAGMDLSPYGEVAIAISDKNSVSNARLSGPTKIADIPSPYAVAFCGDSSTLAADVQMLVTSPSEGLVTWLDASHNVLTKIRTAARPYAVACWTPGAAFVSYDDDTLALATLHSGTATYAGVAVSRSLRGIAPVSSKAGSRVWVAGTDSNLVTVVDLDAGRVLARIPVRRPTAIRRSRSGGQVYVASADDNTILSIDADTLAILPPYLSNVPNPQDIDTGSDVSGNAGDIGYIIPGGSLNSVAQVWKGQVRIIPGIPGAASVANQRYSAWVTGPDANSVYYIHQAQPPPTFLLANAASFESSNALSSFGPGPGSLASKFASTGAMQNYYASSLPLPTTLGGVSISTGGKLDYSLSEGWTYSGGTLAPLLFVGPNQINFQIPPGVTPGDVAMQLRGPDGKPRATGMVRVTASWPGIFTFLMNGKGQGAVLNQDNSQNGDPQNFVGVKPAARGSVIQIFATGAGDTTPALAAGEAAPTSGNPLVLTKVQPTVTIGGKNARVLFSGMAPGYVGVWQINAEVPADVTPSTAVQLVVTAGGAASNTVTIAVQ